MGVVEGGEEKLSFARRILPLAVVTAGTLFVFRPWRWEPFAAEDFSEFLPLLSSSLSNSVGRLVSYYVSHGRWNPVSQLYIAGNWFLFGDHSVGWNLARAALMVANLALLYVLLRRLGVSGRSSSVATALLAVSSTATGNWTRMTAEPLGVMALLLGILFAAGYRGSQRWRLRAVGVGATAATAILAKEVLIAVVPFLLFFGLAWKDCTVAPRVRPLSRRQIWLVIVVAVMAGSAMVPVLIAARGAGTDAYASAYGLGQLHIWGLIDLIFTEAVPFYLHEGATLAALLLDELFVVVLWRGWRRRYGRLGRRRGLIELALLLSLPVAGGLVYWPWPRFESFYALPFFLGSLVLMGFALDELKAAGRWERGFCWLAVAMLVAGGAADSWNTANLTNAQRRVDWTAAQSLPALPRGKGLVMSVAGTPEVSWQGPGPTLSRFAVAIAKVPVVLPPAEDRSCEAVRVMRDNSQRQDVIMNYVHMCGSLSDPSTRIVRVYHRLSWTWLPVASDSVVLEIFLPELLPRPGKAGE